MEIALIGMAGSGKSTVAKELGVRLNLEVIDLDKEIEKREGKELQEIVDRKGEEEFLEIEEKIALTFLNRENCVLDAGGSIIYSKKVMQKLKKKFKVIFIRLNISEIKRRNDNLNKRGVVGLKRKSFENLYKERLPLYKKYSDLVVKENKVKDTVDKIINSVK